MVGVVRIGTVIGISPCRIDEPHDQIRQPLRKSLFEQVFFICNRFSEDDEDKEEAQNLKSEEIFGREQTENLQQDGESEEWLRIAVVT